MVSWCRVPLAFPTGLLNRGLAEQLLEGEAERLIRKPIDVRLPAIARRCRFDLAGRSRATSPHRRRAAPDRGAISRLVTRVTAPSPSPPWQPCRWAADLVLVIAPFFQFALLLVIPGVLLILPTALFWTAAGGDEPVSPASPPAMDGEETEGVFHPPRREWAGTRTAARWSIRSNRRLAQAGQRRPLFPSGVSNYQRKLSGSSSPPARLSQRRRYAFARTSAAIRKCSAWNSGRFISVAQRASRRWASPATMSLLHNRANRCSASPSSSGSGAAFSAGVRRYAGEQCLARRGSRILARLGAYSHKIRKMGTESCGK
jgi:hypothetical protein